MSQLSFCEVLTAMPVDGNAVGGGTSLAVVNQNNIITLPNHFMRLGKIIRINLFGRIVMPVSNTGQSVTLQFNLGTNGATNVFNLTGVTTSTSITPAAPFHFMGIFVVRATGTGTSANAFGIFRMHSQLVVGSVDPATGGQASLLCSTGAPTVSSGFDYTLANQPNLNFGFGSGINSLTPTQYVLEALN